MFLPPSHIKVFVFLNHLRFQVVPAFVFTDVKPEQLIDKRAVESGAPRAHRTFSLVGVRR